MRNHISAHVINGSLQKDERLCGFCGKIGCNISFKLSSGYGKSKTYAPFSNCDYYREFKLKPASTTKASNPSTNRPVQCEVCKDTDNLEKSKHVYWSYNIEKHYQAAHSTLTPPELISQEEIQFLLNRKDD